MAFGLFRQVEKIERALTKTRVNWGTSLSGFLKTKSISDVSLWQDLEDSLISADIGVEASEQLIGRVQSKLGGVKNLDRGQVVTLIKEDLVELMGKGTMDPLILQNKMPNGVKPYVILVVGVNGVGKTTSIAKLTHCFCELGWRVLLAAGDTFRAAASDQLKIWGGRLGVDVVAHQSGADPGAVVYDAYNAALARNIDIVIIDTAGRIHTKINLMEELQKIRRVLSRLDPLAPHQTLLVLDATTGQNGLSQAIGFNDAVGVDGVFLAKLDGTAKGGIVVPIGSELGVPVLFVGTGEGLDDISSFHADDFVEALFRDWNNLGQAANED